MVAQVPPVDVLTTMLDDTIPLTTFEYEEWGKPPNIPEQYEWMKAYSPYDNVAAKAYPAMLVLAGQRQPGRLFRAGQVGRQAARHQDRPESIAVRDQYGAGHSGNSGCTAGRRPGQDLCLAARPGLEIGFSGAAGLEPAALHKMQPNYARGFEVGPGFDKLSSSSAGDHTRVREIAASQAVLKEEPPTPTRRIPGRSC